MRRSAITIRFLTLRAHDPPAAPFAPSPPVRSMPRKANGISEA
jgi:hypothetical protein